MSKKKILIIPMEIAFRELTGRLLVCVEALKYNWSCVILTRRSLIRNISKIPQGVVLIKSAHDGDLEYMKLLSSYGHKIVCLDEEGLVQRSMDDLVRLRSSVDSMRLLDYYFVWGEAQNHAFLGEYPEHKDIIGIVGNPRVDIWQGKHNYLYGSKIHQLNQQYGSYILIPSCFAMYNHFTGFNRATDIVQSINPKSDSDSYEEEVQYTKYVEKAYHNYISLIKTISEKFPGYEIVMKVHPSENPDTWIELSHSITNFNVIKSGSLLELIMGCEVMVHCGSTSAVEAYMCGKPVISYCLDAIEDNHLLEVPTFVSKHANTKKDVISLLSNILVKGKTMKNLVDVKVTNKYIKNLVGNYKSNTSSSKIILQYLKRLNIKETSSRFNGIVGEAYKDNWRERIVLLVNPLVSLLRIDKFMPAVYKRQIRGIEYGNRKYEGLNIDVIKNELDLITKNEGVNYKRVIECSNDFFLIE